MVGKKKRFDGLIGSSSATDSNLWNVPGSSKASMPSSSSKLQVAGKAYPVEENVGELERLKGDGGAVLHCDRGVPGGNNRFLGVPVGTLVPLVVPATFSTGLASGDALASPPITSPASFLFHAELMISVKEFLCWMRVRVGDISR
jgi:hypothetical protein